MTVRIFLSAAAEGELADLQHDFYCTNPQDMKNHILAKRADALKNTDKGVNKMSEVMEQLIREVNIENQKVFDSMKMELEKARTAEEKAKAAEEKAKAAEEKARADAEKLRAEAAEEKLLNYKRAFKLSNDMRRMGIPESEISRSIEEAFGIAA